MSAFDPKRTLAEFEKHTLPLDTGSRFIVTACHWRAPAPSLSITWRRLRLI
jgi:hypothetical protein